jgi:hypothetical protein
MKRIVLIGVVALCALMRPVSAFAQTDFLDWLEGLSGPGPFHGYFMSANSRVFCTLNDGGTTKPGWCFDDTSQKIRTVMTAEFAWASSDSNTRFADASAEAQNTLPVHATRVLVNYYYRFHPMVDLGIGVGAIVFSGDDFTNQTHPVLTPLALTFTPLGFLHDKDNAKWGRLIRIKYSERYILGDIRATDFHSLVSTYLKHGEFNRGISLAVDFWPFLVRKP